VKAEVARNVMKEIEVD
jgi:hypothetical protein